MRKPTSKEKCVMKNALEGLKEDIEALCKDEVSSDILGTMHVNLTVLVNMMNRMVSEKEKP